MEGIFLHFVVEAVKGIVNGIDGLFEKSLQRAIPDLDQLLEDPHKTLDHRAIIIGPRRTYCSATLVGVILALAGIGVCVIIFSIIEDLPGRKKFSDAFWLGALTPVALCCFVFGFRIFRGGYCILTQEGAEFRYRKKVVCCSWPVFHAWGQQVFIKESNLLLLPISPHATDSIMEMNKDESEARYTGLEVHTPQWETHTPVEAALKPLYVVKIQELGGLLLQLGRKLGADQAVAQALPAQTDWSESTKTQPQLQASGQFRQSAEGQPARTQLLPADSRLIPIAFQEKDGWLRFSLTRFYLPPFCCICTVPTGNSLLYNLPNRGQSDPYPIHLPTCDLCRRTMRRRKRITILFMLGLPLAFLLAIVLLFDPLRAWLSLLLIILALASFLGSWIISESFFGPPAKVRYSSKKGTLRIWFRNADFVKLVLAQKVPH
jgi:hypothetical protein